MENVPAHSPRRPARPQWACLALITSSLMLSGCNKHKPIATGNNPAPDASAAAPGNSQANPPFAAGVNVTPVAIAPAGADPAPMLAQMTQVLRRFSVEHRQVPKSLNDLVAAGYLTALPAAPAGKQFAIVLQ
jgi:hypothetical protein